MKYNTVVSIITFLKMDNRPDYHGEIKSKVSIKKLENPIKIDDYLKMYIAVGDDLNWLDRVFMDKDLLYEKINDSKTHIYTFLIDNKFGGYCELIENKKYVEILYFGLIQKFIGKGYGKYLLNKTIELAWSYHPQWVQLNTCDLDHPNALSIYKKAGFKPYKTIKEEKKIKE